MKIKKIVPGVALVIIGLFGCYHDKEEILYPAATNNCENIASKGIKFSHVEYIINSNCVSCHNAGGTEPDLSTACKIVEKWERINERCVVQKNMPQNTPLINADQQAITEWVNAGHKYTD